MTDSEAPHYLVDLNFDCVADLCISHKYDKSFNSGNAVAFAGNVFNFNIILFSNRYWYSWSGSAIGRSFFASEQIFTVLRENYKTVLRDSNLAIRLLNPFAHRDLLVSFKNWRSGVISSQSMPIFQSLVHIK